MKDIGRRIAALRASAGLTQRELAARVGVEAATLANYERGRREPSLETLALIAKELGADLAELVGSPDAPMTNRVDILLRALIDSVETLKQATQNERLRLENERLRIERVEAPRAEAQNRVEQLLERLLEEHGLPSLPGRQDAGAAEA